MEFHLTGDLDIRGEDGVAIRVRGTGSHLDIEIESRKSSFLTGLKQARRSLPLVRSTAIACARAGITTTVRIGKRRVMTLGRGVEGDSLARLLRIQHARLR